MITGGEVVFHDGRPAEAGGLGSLAVLEAPPDVLRRLRWSEVAVVFQSAMNALNPVLTIEAQLTDVAGRPPARHGRRARRARAAELLDLVGINADRLRSYPHELPGGCASES